MREGVSANLHESFDNQAPRALANRLVGILHGCLRRRCLYDEAVAWLQPLKEAA